MMRVVAESAEIKNQQTDERGAVRSTSKDTQKVGQIASALCNPIVSIPQKKLMPPLQKHAAHVDHGVVPLWSVVNEYTF